MQSSLLYQVRPRTLLQLETVSWPSPHRCTTTRCVEYKLYSVPPERSKEDQRLGSNRILKIQWTPSIEYITSQSSSSTAGVHLISQLGSFEHRSAVRHTLCSFHLHRTFKIYSASQGRGRHGSSIYIVIQGLCVPLPMLVEHRSCCTTTRFLKCKLYSLPVPIAGH